MQLPLLRSVIRETFRLHAPVPAVVRLVTQDLTLPFSNDPDRACSVFVVPKGDYLLSSIEMLHRNSDLWEDPLKWNPARWLDMHAEDTGAGLTSQNPHYQPFGVGKHRCSGESVSSTLSL